jgi:hypothetical protein
MRHFRGEFFEIPADHPPERASETASPPSAYVVFYEIPTAALLEILGAGAIPQQVRAGSYVLESLVWITAILCVGGVTQAYLKYRDPFHPAVIMLPMFAFIYVIMPLFQIHSGAVFALVGEQDLIRVQSIVVAGLICLIIGINRGSLAPPAALNPELIGYSPEILHKGAYAIGSIGLCAWFFVIHAGGGFTSVFGQANGRGWSDLGFVREAVYLLIVAVLLLISPEGYDPGNKRWRAAVVCFSLPFLIQGLLGAQRGPTFLIVVSLGMSWYLARFRRPSLAILLGGGVALGLLLAFLVTNRSSIYVGSDKKMRTDVSGLLEASEANEYVFGAACMLTADAENKYFWGRRYLAQVIVRPIPKQIWPNKYEDFGVPELLQNAGVAGEGLTSVMGWAQVPGSAAAMIADLWVEFSWLEFPVLIAIGYAYGLVWKRAVTVGGVWTTQYVIFALLSIYMVTQSGEAVIFRFVILTLPVQYIWRKAEITGTPA